MTQEKTTLSACLIVKNEEKLLPECLDSLRAIVDEIVVADTGSSDQSVEIARKGGARVFTHPWSDDFSAARNAALEQARGDWILTIDADERLEWKDAASFKKPLREKGKWGFILTLVNVFEERSSEVLLLRLFRNHPEIRYTGLVHERVDPSLAEVSGDFEKAVGRHPARIFHQGYLVERRREKEKDDRDIRLLKKQIDLWPTDPYHWYKFAAHPFARRHMTEDAAQALARAWELLREQDPRGTKFSYTSEVAALHILSLLGSRNLSAARALADEAEKLARPSPNLDYALGICAMAAHDLDCASRHLEGALAEDGKVLPYAPLEGVTDFLSLNALSEVRYLQGRREESEELFERACAVGGQELANAFHGPAPLAARKGDPALAIMLLTAAAQFAPDDPFPWKRGGQILSALGLHERALEWLKRAVTRAPEDRNIVGLLEEARTHLYPVCTT